MSVIASTANPAAPLPVQPSPVFRSLPHPPESGKGRARPQVDEALTRATDALLAALEARGHVFTPRRADLADEAPLEMDPRLSADYSHALDQIFTATARFRARRIAHSRAGRRS